jgi:hypothetical protein
VKEAKMTKAKGGLKRRPDGKFDTGRPTNLTPETISKLEQAWSMGCSDLEACLHAGIGKSALYNYQNAHPNFLERKQILKEKLVLKARSVIANALNNKDENTARWYLERKRKDEFSTRTEQTGKDGASLVQKIFVTQEMHQNTIDHINAVLEEQ